jgi:hypothetical protein
MVADSLGVLFSKATFWRNLNMDPRMRIENERLNKTNVNKEITVNVIPFALSPRSVLNSL